MSSGGRSHRTSANRPSGRQRRGGVIEPVEIEDPSAGGDEDDDDDDGMLQHVQQRRGGDNNYSGGGGRRSATGRRSAVVTTSSKNSKKLGVFEVDDAGSGFSSKGSRSSSGSRGGSQERGGGAMPPPRGPPGGSGDNRRSSLTRFHSMEHRSGTTKKSLEKAMESTIYEEIPSEYRLNPTTVEPMLFFLPRTARSHQFGSAGQARLQQQNSVTLDKLLQAAESDVRLHRARIKASIEDDLRLIRTYQLETDPQYLARAERLEERAAQIQQLQEESETIVRDLRDLKNNNTSSNSNALTVSERTQVLLAHWQRALELHVFTRQSEHDLDWQSLFETLLDGVQEDQDTAVLAEAARMCYDLVRVCQKSVVDTAQHVMDQESSYAVRLQAHQMFATECFKEVGSIEEQFKTSGRAALQIGHQLEHAELKRNQCEAASILIRRWWMLENLAEQQAASGQEIPVRDEVLGNVAPSECMMDALFTQPEHSLDAARALKQLRAVVQSRGSSHGNAGAAGSGGGGGGTADGGGGGGVGVIGDKASIRRFDLTARLITRTSDALEQRLLNSFSEVYSGGGIYDFSPKPRPGSIDWRELRALAQALLLFDSGRNLHQRYVDMVVTSRFPELFQDDEDAGDAADDNNDNGNNNKNTMMDGSGHSDTRGDNTSADVSESSDTGGSNSNHDRSSLGAGAGTGDKTTTATGDGKSKFDMDSMRSKLSSLFHRVSDVCSAEFELVAHVFGAEDSRTDLLDGSEEMPLVVARALLQRVVSDPRYGLQMRINDLLSGIDRRGDFEAGAKKLDTFVVIHEKAAGLFGLLKDAAERMVPADDGSHSKSKQVAAAKAAVESLKGFLTSQELALSNTHRQGYINLELRLLHHNCCQGLDRAGCTLVKGPVPRPDAILAEKGILEEYRAPILPLFKDALYKSGYQGILAGALKQSVLRQPLIHATDSLARARLMFGTNKRGGETTSRVILSIYGQMCSFYGEGFLYPIVETLKEMLPTNPPGQPPQLPFDEEVEAPDLGVSPAFWVALERVHSAAKSFDRELWAEQRADSQRVWETLEQCGDAASMVTAREGRAFFYSELERRGEAAIVTALDTLSTHIQWVLVTGGESMLATGGTRVFSQLTGQSGGPYSIPSGASLEAPNSPAVKSLTYCLRVQFVHVQAALTSQSLASFWTALSMRLYDILVARLLQYYQISTVGAVILSRDVEALRSVAMLAGSDHGHWDTLRELLTLYMTPPDAIKTMLVGPEGESHKGLFAKAGRDQCLVFLSRRNDYRYKTAAGPKKSGWAMEMLTELAITDPSDGPVNIGLFAAGRNKQ